MLFSRYISIHGFISCCNIFKFSLTTVTFSDEKQQQQNILQAAIK